MKPRINAQISVYLLLAIGIVMILIISLSAFFMFTKNPIESISKLQKNSKTEKIYNAIDSCLENSGKNAVSFAMRHGATYGIYQYVKEPFYSTSYHYYDSMNYAPTKTETELFIDMLFANSVKNCFKKIQENYSTELTYGNIQTEVIISNESILLTVNTPVTIQQQENTFNENKFTYLLENIYLEKFLEVSQYLAEEQVQYKHSACISCAMDAEEMFNVTIGMYEANNKTIIFEVSDNKSQIYSELIVYRFGHHYGILDE